MSLELDQSWRICSRDIVGIFSTATLKSNITGEFLNTAREEGFLMGADTGQMKSFIVANEHVFSSALLPSVLCKRVFSRGIALLQKDLSY